MTKRGIRGGIVPAVSVGAVILFTRLVAAPSWTKLAPAGGPPPLRSHSAGAYDASTNRLIVFGGENCSPMNDTWVLTNADGLGGTPTWILLAPSGAQPEPRYGARVAYDAATNRLIMFGGFAGSACVYSNSSRNDVWILSNANGLGGTPEWTRLAPAGSPPAGRVRSSAVYDSVANRLIVFAGNPAEGFCNQGSNDTWVLTNANGTGGSPQWLQLTTPTAPSPREGHTAVYDEATRRMTIVGGYTSCGAAMNDVWVLADANGIGTPSWTRITPGGSVVPGLGQHSAVYDSSRNQMTIYGMGQVWTLDGANGLAPATWSSVWTTAQAGSDAPPPGDPGIRNLHVAGWDDATSRMIVFGGNVYSGRNGDVWVYTNGSGGAPPDTVGPVLSLPDDIVREASGLPGGESVTFTVTAIDAVDGSVPVSCSHLSGMMFPIGTTTEVVCSATDAAGNTTSGSFTITVVDTTPPTLQIVSPAADDVFTSSPVHVVVLAADAVGVTQVAINGMTAMLAAFGRWEADTYVSLPVLPGRSLTFTAVATDMAGNQSSAVVVVDNDGIVSTIDRQPGALDSSGYYSDEFNNGAAFGRIADRGGWVLRLAPQGADTVRARIDGEGTGPVAIKLCGPPYKSVILDAAGETVDISCDGDSAVVTAVSALPEIEALKQPEYPALNGTSTPLATGQGLTFGSPLQAHASNEAPLFVKVLGHQGQPFATIELDPGEVVDIDVSAAAAAGIDAATLTVQEGEVPVTVSGVTHVFTPSSGPQNVEPDVTPPAATLTLSPAQLWPPNHRMVDIDVALVASDAAGGPVTIEGPFITSSEPPNGTGDGDASPDWSVGSDNRVSLRAERSGRGGGRVYTLTYRVTDVVGNSREVSATVTVPKSMGR